MKTAVVTGAARGLGSHIARELAERGYGVLVTDIDEVAAVETARRLGPEAWAMHQDVRDAESHHRVAASAAERGTLAVWVNNAGVLYSGAAWDMSAELVRRQVDVNVLGVMFGCHAALAHMERGHIINIASMSALVPTPGLAVYGATKQAVLGYTISLYGELERAKRPVRVTAVCPDAIETDLVRNVEHDEHASILFSASKLLSPERVAAKVVRQIDRPGLVAIYPLHRGVLAHVFRPIPRVGLVVLDQLRKIGDYRRRKRS